MSQQVTSLIALVPILPLVGAILNGLYSFSGARLVRPFVHWIACGSLFLSFFISVGAFFHLSGLSEEGRQVTVALFPWLKLGSLSADVAFLIDPLSVTMMLVVTGVGSLIHLYSIGYMAHDPGYARYFSYLNLFCFAMLTLVMGDNLLMMFVGWEGVGLCSYLLIGFWFTDREKAVAGMKAFVVNRIGDFGFVVGFLLLFWTLFSVGKPTVTFTGIREAAPLLADKTWLGVSIATLVSLFFFVGATGKSAQIPLYVWLPDAMAGPTPVSALIHAATMVTAGVYMIARMSFLYSLSPEALSVVAAVGFATAIFSATIGLAQNDIKKVLAYSTVSQLGFLFGAMGVAAYSAGIFHLVTHAFFKACLFLGSGSVIHAMSGEQDIRKMGGLKDFLPVTFKTFFIATLAIAGIFPLAGFFSKDEILAKAFEQSPWLWAVGILAAAGTALYMFRLVMLTFFGECRADEKTRHHIHESPSTMTIPLIVLAALSIVGGFLGVPESLGHLFGLDHSNLIEHWLEPVLAMSGDGAQQAAPLPAIAEYTLMFVSLAIAVGGIYLAWILYNRRREIPARIVQKFPILYKLVANKYYIDEIYEIVFVKTLLRLNDLLARFDLKVIDGAVNFSALATRITSFVSGWFDRTFVDGAVNLTADVASWGGAGLRRIQTGRIQTYLYYAMGGILLVVLYRFL